MVLRLTHELILDDLRNHPAETVEEVRSLLAAGATARPDPRRKNFYELEGHSQVFYVYVYPRGSKVLLLAAWPRDIPATVTAIDRAAD